jgi:hypothetical protein
LMPLLDVWTQRPAHQSPYRWLSTEPGEMLSDEWARVLVEGFPVERFARRDASGRVDGKRYRNASRTLVEGDAVLDHDLPEAWRDLVAALLTLEYRESVASLLNQEVAGSLELRLVRHDPGDWLGPHTDREDKLFSHILYFNDGWQEEWGGCLEILLGDDPAAVAGRVVPRLGASALLAQASNSWHQVTPVRGTLMRSRQSLLIHGLSGT